jgi:hypothetical protein
MTRTGILTAATNRTVTVLLIPLVPCVGYRHVVASDEDAREGKVLKIIITETPTEIRWVLQGRLFGPQVTEVRANWSRANRIRMGRSCVVDLAALTFLDNRGRRLLRAMSRDGAQFIANGLNNTHLIDELKISSMRGLSRMIASFLRLSRQ